MRKAKAPRKAPSAVPLKETAAKGAAAEGAASGVAVVADVRPGALVSLHSLSRTDLNGKRGVCGRWVADAGRWEVRFSGLQPTALKVKPANLERVVSARCSAADALCSHLREEYPERGFKLSPSVAFESDQDGLGICARATADISKGDILLVVPEAATISLRAPSCTNLVLPTGMPLNLILDKVGKVYDGAHLDVEGGNLLSSEDAKLVVLLMYLACQPEQGEEILELHARVARVWPSLAEARRLPVFWGRAALEKIRGTGAAQHVGDLLLELKALFGRVIEPVLATMCREGTAAHFTLRGETLETSFRFAQALAYSRAHETSAASGPESKPEGKLSTLVDCLNGLPGPHPAINVEVNRGKWPWVRGKVFLNECNLPCSAVAATRDVRAGDDLIIDYGETHTAGFALRFGVVPLPVLRWDNQMDYVELLVPPDLMPPSSDTVRHSAIREIFGFEAERAQGFVLQTADLAQMRMRREPEAVASFRQFVTLLVANDLMVLTFVEEVL